MFCLKTERDNGIKSDICFQWGKVPVASCSSSDSDCASLPDLDTSAVYLPRKMKVWLSHNKLTHAHSALAGTCTAVTMWWQSSLQQPKCNSSAAWGPIAACAAVPPPLQIHELVRAKLPWKEEGAAALAQCCFVSSAVLSAPGVQQPCAIPAQGALHPSYGWQRAEEAGPSAHFPLRTLSSSCCGG